MIPALVAVVSLLAGVRVGFRLGREAGYNVGLAEGRGEPCYVETLCPNCIDAKEYRR